MEITIIPKPITKKKFSKFGDMITTDDLEPIEINSGYAKRFDSIANLNTSKDNGVSTISIFSALKRSFPMKIDMMEKHPLGSQAFIPMKETTFLTFVAPKGEKPDLKKFPCIQLAYEALKEGGTFPIVLNVANDEVVEAFLNNYIQFSDVPNLIENALNQHEFIDNPDLRTIFEISQWTENYIHDEIAAVV